MKRVSVFMDVEDPIDPLSDDAALDFAELFNDLGIRGSFCVTGEKCRALTSRGRVDVADAFRPHCLGLHTDTHSYHPTTMELLAGMSFGEGRDAAYAAERPGFDSFFELFGRAPIFWGGAGNTWSPEITDALRRLGIPACVYAVTALPDNAVHRFNGVVAMPQAFSISEEDWAESARAEANSAMVLADISAGSQPWLGVFVGHPTRFCHKEFWDVPFFNGKTPNRLEPAKLAPRETYERSKRNLRRFLTALADQAEVIGVDEALGLPWTYRIPTNAERAFFRHTSAEKIRRAARWPVHRQDLDAENIVAKTLALEATLELGSAS